nr:MAG TPA: hypothetical protein [Caudoviricetes sp.]
MSEFGCKLNKRDKEIRNMQKHKKMHLNLK